MGDAALIWEAPAGATILTCYHPPDFRRTIMVGVLPYQSCRYCLAMRAGNTGHWPPAVRFHTATELYDRDKQLLCSRWNAKVGEVTSRPDLSQ